MRGVAVGCGRRLVGVGMMRMGGMLVRMSFVGMLDFGMGFGVAAFGGIVIGRKDVDLCAGETAAHHLARFETSAYIQRGRSLLEKIEGHSRVDEGAEQHISAYAGKALQIANSHRL